MKIFKTPQIRYLVLILLGFGLSVSLAYNTLDRVFFSDYIEKAALKNAKNKSGERERFLHAFLNRSQNYLYSMASFSAFQKFLHDRSQKALVQELFTQYVQNCGEIMQIRFIDPQGKEVVRVHRSEYGAPVEVVEDEDLQDKSSRYFFKDSKSKMSGQVWFSDVDLQTEYGKVVTPFLPTLRAILPLEVDGEFSGILVINYFMQPVLQNLLDAPLYDSILVNEKGEVLIHYDSSKSWGSYRDGGYSLANEYPQRFQQIISSQTYSGDNFFFKKFDTPINTELGIVFKLRASFAENQRAQLAERELLVFLVILAFSLVMIYVVVKLFSKTLLRLDTIDKLNSSLNEASKVAKIGFWEYLSGAKYLQWSEGVYDIFDITDYARKITYEDFLSFIPDKDKKNLDQGFQQSIKSATPYFVTHKVITERGKLKYVEERARHLYDLNGKHLKSVGSIYDVTEKQLIQQRYDQERTKLFELMNNASDAIFIMQTDGRILEANKRVCEFLGYSLDEIMQLSVYDWDKEITKENFPSIVALLSYDKPINLERVHTRKDGTTYEAEVSATLIHIGDEDLIYAAVRDISEKKAQQRLLLDKTNELQAIFDAAREGIAVIDQEMHYLKVNQKYCELLGYSQPELLQLSCNDLTHPDYLQENRKIMQQVFEKGFCEDFERVCINKNGEEKILSSSLSLIPQSRQVIVVSVDHTQMRNYEQQLVRLTKTDELTKLRNRKAFNERISEQLKLYQRYRQPFCMLIFDIDNFKSINDQYGHKTGDDVLIKLSETLTKTIRKTDLAFRVGGEEFVVLAPQSTLEEGRVLAEKIRLSIEEEVNLIKDRLVTISSGLVEVSEDDNPDSIYQRADDLLYKAKNSGKNCVCS